MLPANKSGIRASIIDTADVGLTNASKADLIQAGSGKQVHECIEGFRGSGLHDLGDVCLYRRM